MKADQMRKISDKFHNENNSVHGIIAVINDAAEKGEYECWYYETITLSQRQKLTELGYSVGQTQFDRNETLTKIKWT